MSLTQTLLLVAICAFGLGMLLGPPVIALGTKLKAGQNILSYVGQHSCKQGTPTFGGLIFIVASVIVALIFGVHKTTLGLMTMLIFSGYGIIGFLDDFIKVKLKRNEGLKAYQKVLVQLVVAVASAYFAYTNEFIGSKIALNFGMGYVDLGWWYLPFATITFIAMTNAVNLTDGLDGLAGTTSAIYLLTFLCMTAVLIVGAESSGNTVYLSELKGMATFVSATVGGIVAFLWFNSNKASVFMGDTGSLALGGLCATVALFVKNPLASIIVGIMFVLSCISVIVQVAVYKLKGRRVLLMAPLHHHLELKGVNESKIVACYGIITAVAGALTLIII